MQYDFDASTLYCNLPRPDFNVIGTKTDLGWLDNDIFRVHKHLTGHQFLQSFRVCETHPGEIQNECEMILTHALADTYAI